MADTFEIYFDTMEGLQQLLVAYRGRTVLCENHLDAVRVVCFDVPGNFRRHLERCRLHCGVPDVLLSLQIHEEATDESHQDTSALCEQELFW